MNDDVTIRDGVPSANAEFAEDSGDDVSDVNAETTECHCDDIPDVSGGFIEGYFVMVDMFAASTIDNLEIMSTDVVRAKVGNRTVTPMTAVNQYQVITRLEVLEVFKGDSKIGDTIEITQGIGGTKRSNIDDYILSFGEFDCGDELVFFLDSGLWWWEDRLMHLTQISQSVYQAPSLERAGESLSSHNDLVLTIEDLQRIHDKNFLDSTSDASTDPTEDPGDNVPSVSAELVAEHAPISFVWDDMPDLSAGFIEGQAILPQLAPAWGINGLDRMSTDIVRAKVLDRTVTPLEAENRFQVSCRLEVLEVFKGSSVAGDVIEITKNIGGTIRIYGDHQLSFGEFERGEELIFFLDSAWKESLDSRWTDWAEDHQMVLAHELESVFRLSNSGEFFVRIHWADHHTIWTVADLQQHFEYMKENNPDSLMEVDLQTQTFNLGILFAEDLQRIRDENFQ